jgi:hypothetical protein
MTSTDHDAISAATIASLREHGDLSGLSDQVLAAALRAYGRTAEVMGANGVDEVRYIDELYRRSPVLSVLHHVMREATDAELAARPFDPMALPSATSPAAVRVREIHDKAVAKWIADPAEFHG